MHKSALSSLRTASSVIASRPSPVIASRRRSNLIIIGAIIAFFFASVIAPTASAKTINLGSAGDILYFQGSVGVGTAAPSSTLTVAGAIRTTSVGVIFPDNTTQATAYAGGTQTIVAGNVSSGAFGSNTGNGNYSFPANVGIGTTGPTQPLHIVSSVATGFKLTHSIGTAAISQVMSNTGGNLYIGIDSSAGGNFVTGAYARFIYSDGAYPLVFVTNAAEAMRITSAGNVGIGTTAPGTLLQVGNTTSIGQVLTLQASANSGEGPVLIGKRTSTIAFQIGTESAISGGAGNTNLALYAGAGAVTLWGSGTLALTANSTGVLIPGNVGIGTGTPLATGGLTIAKSAPASITTANNFLQLGNNNYGIGYFTIGFGYVVTETYMPAYMGYVSTDTSGVTKGALIFGTRDAVTDILPTERMRINSAGNVGIGTTGPQAKLHIDGGSIRVDGSSPFLYLRGGATGDKGRITLNHYGYASYDIVAGDNANGLLSISPSGAATGLFMNSSGNVGIGTTAPGTYKLNVNGTGKFSNTLTLGAVGIAGSALNIGVGNAGYYSAYIEGSGVGSSSWGLHIVASTNNNDLALHTTNYAGVTLFDVSGGGQARFGPGNTGNPTISGNEIGDPLQPSYSFTGDLNTGMYRAATDTLGFSTAGAERIRIDGSGNVGIGTTNPLTNLHVDSTTAGNPIVTIRKSNSGTANQDGGILYFDNLHAAATGRNAGVKAGTLDFRFSQPSSGAIQSGAQIVALVGTEQGGSSVATDLTFNTATTDGAAPVERVRITYAGNVGIGTTGPGAKLAVRPVADVNLWVGRTDYGTTGVISSVNDAANAFQPLELQGSVISLTQGNVGIGTTAPTQGKLVVESSSSGAVTLPLVLMNSGTSANGTGSQINFRALRSDGANQQFAYINSVVTDNTISSEDARLTLGTQINGTLTDTLSVTAGNVGIGTTGPGYKLDVVGNINGSTGVYDAGNRVYSASNVPPNPFNNIIAFTTSGTWTKPANVTKVRVRLVGGGGAGGAGGGSLGGAGGGGGGYCEKLVDVTGVGSVAVTVGGAGGTSSFGAYCSATGGSAGASDGASGGAGGAGTSGIINSNGDAGNGDSGGGGGAGGSSILGGGGLGSITGAGGAGGYGGGGGGGVGGGGAAGAGGGGLVIVEEYK